MITVYGISNCDTVKKARAWLATQGLAHEFHDFKKLGIPAARLRIWEQAVGWHKLLNRQGTTWRKLDPGEQASATDAAGALTVMQAHASVIKRPVVEWPGGQITVGFEPTAWGALA
ncbi:arsenate reductase [Polaromonas eurypsychrophila]|uniref:Arsenate reductase n=1 Tax=Polaromonas eurypsychrophila TaxID=1614635 RepID=A0A916SFN7_9BURK|nr:arsenate reductase [Polaromonas eurypsychrophila]GGA97888.1 arsenate reductase [Polaromonas eurypsychrophila]